MQWQQVFPHPSDDTLFCIASDGREIHFGEFIHDLSAARAQLQSHTQTDEVVGEVAGESANASAALYSTDTYTFGVWLFAGLAEGLTLVVPANNKRATARALADVSLWLGEWPEQQGAFVDFAGTGASGNTSLPPSFSGRLQLFTSGSSGEPQRIDKTLAQLLAEIAAQQRQWGEQIVAASVLATVSHQHIYGLLFKLLWPIYCGRPFISRTYVDVAALLRDAARYRPAVWVASPAQLSRRNDAWPWKLSSHLVGIFSSGGPLAADDAAAIAGLCGQWPIEIYGSTETGGIAWRQQTAGNMWWSPLSGVKTTTREGQLLQVSSPWISEGFATQDRAQIQGGQFQLLGRADQIAKIEEKRISLTQVETLLKNTEWVADAKVLVLPKGAACSRELLGALIVPTEAALAQLQVGGKSALVRQLRAALAPDLDGVALPRSWRFLPAIPVNQQGKSPRELLMQQFESETSEPGALLQDQKPQDLIPQAMLPQIESSEVVNGDDSAPVRARVDLRIPRNLPCLPGHFDTAPVVPGVVQIDWAAHFGKTLLGIEGVFSGMENIKFKQLMVPEEQAQLELTFDREKHKLSYRFFWQSDEFSSGKLSFQHG